MSRAGASSRTKTDDDNPDVRVEEEGSAESEVSRHLFAKLRGSNNLVFAGSRGQVELLANRLRETCDAANLPQEFYPHHASLSKDHREFVERRLKDGVLPTTAICTSTLELGIDIGDVTCVAQVGAPFTVASLRQRLGRSGRRAGQPAVLRQYAIETAVDAKSHFADRLRLGLMRSIAMIDLLLEKWCESPRADALHLSTLVHQILSVIAERGGVSAARLFATLCRAGPFTGIDATIFAEVLRALGDPETALIEQGADGLLLLGRQGERLVEHYSFFAVFRTPEEFRLVSNGRELGTIPIENIMAPGMALIFSGRRWEVVNVDDVVRIIQVKPARGGVPPMFGGDAGDIDDHVIERMRRIYLSDDVPIYLDDRARELLAEARAGFAALGLCSSRIIAIEEKSDLVATYAGSASTRTLALMLRAFGFTVTPFDGFLEISRTRVETTTREALRAIADGEAPEMFFDEPTLIFEKFHPYLTSELLEKDALSSKLNIAHARLVAAEVFNEV